MPAAARPGLINGIKQFAEPERTIIQGKTARGAVIAVKVALAIPDPDPVSHQRGQTFLEYFGQLYDLFW